MNRLDRPADGTVGHGNHLHWDVVPGLAQLGAVLPVVRDDDEVVAVLGHDLLLGLTASPALDETEIGVGLVTAVYSEVNPGLALQV